MEKTLFEKYLEKVGGGAVYGEATKQSNTYEEQREDESVRDESEDSRETEDTSSEDNGDAESSDSVSAIDGSKDSGMNEEREKVILSWIMILNSKFKPYASFKIIIEKNGLEEDTFLALKPQDSPADRHFYHLSQAEKLNKEVFQDIVELAEKQLSQEASVNEDFTMRAEKGWRKKKNAKAIIEFKTPDGEKTLEVINEFKRGSFNNKDKVIEENAIIYFNSKSNVYQIIEEGVKLSDLKDKLKFYMDKY